MNDHAAVPVRRLDRSQREAMLAHFLHLPAEDRRLRFGAPIGDTAVADYVATLDFERDALFGVFQDNLALAGVAHVAMGPDAAEFGVSVLPAQRGRGVGSALFERANIFARTHLVRAMFMHCLLENRTMMHIARKSGMRIVSESGEADAWLELPPAGFATIANELMAERIGLFDFNMKRNAESVRRFAAVLAGEKIE